MNKTRLIKHLYYIFSRKVHERFMLHDEGNFERIEFNIKQIYSQPSYNTV